MLVARTIVDPQGPSWPFTNCDQVGLGGCNCGGKCGMGDASGRAGYFHLHGRSPGCGGCLVCV